MSYFPTYGMQDDQEEHHVLDHQLDQEEVQAAVVV